MKHEAHIWNIESHKHSADKQSLGRKYFQINFLDIVVSSHMKILPVQAASHLKSHEQKKIMIVILYLIKSFSSGSSSECSLAVVFRLSVDTRSCLPLISTPFSWLSTTSLSSGMSLWQVFWTTILKIWKELIWSRLHCARTDRALKWDRSNRLHTGAECTVNCTTVHNTVQYRSLKSWQFKVLPLP